MEVDQLLDVDYYDDLPFMFEDVLRLHQRSVPRRQPWHSPKHADYLDLEFTETPGLEKETDVSMPAEQLCDSCVDSGQMFSLTADGPYEWLPSKLAAAGLPPDPHLPWSQLHQGDFVPRYGSKEKPQPNLPGIPEDPEPQESYATCNGRVTEIKGRTGEDFAENGMPRPSLEAAKDSRKEATVKTAPDQLEAPGKTGDCQEGSFLAIMLSELEGSSTLQAALTDSELEDSEYTDGTAVNWPCEKDRKSPNTIEELGLENQTIDCVDASDTSKKQKEVKSESCVRGKNSQEDSQYTGNENTKTAAEAGFAKETNAGHEDFSKHLDREAVFSEASSTAKPEENVSDKTNLCLELCNSGLDLGTVEMAQQKQNADGDGSDATTMLNSVAAESREESPQFRTKRDQLNMTQGLEMSRQVSAQRPELRQLELPSGLPPQRDDNQQPDENVTPQVKVLHDRDRRCSSPQVCEFDFALVDHHALPDCEQSSTSGQSPVRYETLIRRYLPEETEDSTTDLAARGSSVDGQYWLLYQRVGDQHIHSDGKHLSHSGHMSCVSPPQAYRINPMSRRNLSSVSPSPVYEMSPSYLDRRDEMDSQASPYSDEENTFKRSEDVESEYADNSFIDYVKQPNVGNSFIDDVKQANAGNSFIGDVKQANASNSFIDDVKQADAGNSFIDDVKQEDTGNSLIEDVKQEETGNSFVDDVKQADAGNSFIDDVKQEDTGNSFIGDVKQTDADNSFIDDVKQEDTGNSFIGDVKQTDAGNSFIDDVKQAGGGNSFIEDVKQADAGNSFIDDVKQADAGNSITDGVKQADADNSFIDDVKEADTITENNTNPAAEECPETFKQYTLLNLERFSSHPNQGRPSNEVYVKGGVKKILPRSALQRTEQNCFATSPEEEHDSDKLSNASHNKAEVTEDFDGQTPKETPKTTRDGSSESGTSGKEVPLSPEEKLDTLIVKREEEAQERPSPPESDWMSRLTDNDIFPVPKQVDDIRKLNRKTRMYALSPTLQTDNCCTGQSRELSKPPSVGRPRAIFDRWPHFTNFETPQPHGLQNSRTSHGNSGANLRSSSAAGNERSENVISPARHPGALRPQNICSGLQKERAVLKKSQRSSIAIQSGGGIVTDGTQAPILKPPRQVYRSGKEKRQTSMPVSKVRSNTLKGKRGKETKTKRKSPLPQTAFKKCNRGGHELSANTRESKKHQMDTNVNREHDEREKLSNRKTYTPSRRKVSINKNYNKSRRSLHRHTKHSVPSENGLPHKGHGVNFVEATAQESRNSLLTRKSKAVESDRLSKQRKSLLQDLKSFHEQDVGHQDSPWEGLEVTQSRILHPLLEDEVTSETSVPVEECAEFEEPPPAEAEYPSKPDVAEIAEEVEHATAPDTPHRDVDVSAKQSGPSWRHFSQMLKSSEAEAHPVDGSESLVTLLRTLPSEVDPDFSDLDVTFLKLQAEKRKRAESSLKKISERNTPVEAESVEGKRSRQGKARKRLRKKKKMGSSERGSGKTKSIGGTSLISEEEEEMSTVTHDDSTVAKSSSDGSTEASQSSKKNVVTGTLLGGPSGDAKKTSALSVLKKEQQEEWANQGADNKETQKEDGKMTGSAQAAALNSKGGGKSATVAAASATRAARATAPVCEACKKIEQQALFGRQPCLKSTPDVALACEFCGERRSARCLAYGGCRCGRGFHSTLLSEPHGAKWWEAPGICSCCDKRNRIIASIKDACSQKTKAEAIAKRETSAVTLNPCQCLHQEQKGLLKKDNSRKMEEKKVETQLSRQPQLREALKYGTPSNVWYEAKPGVYGGKSKSVEDQWDRSEVIASDIGACACKALLVSADSVKQSISNREATCKKVVFSGPIAASIDNHKKRIRTAIMEQKRSPMCFCRTKFDSGFPAYHVQVLQSGTPEQVKYYGVNSSDLKTTDCDIPSVVTGPEKHEAEVEVVAVERKPKQEDSVRVGKDKNIPVVKEKRLERLKQDGRCETQVADTPAEGISKTWVNIGISTVRLQNETIRSSTAKAASSQPQAPTSQSAAMQAATRTKPQKSTSCYDVFSPQIWRQKDPVRKRWVKTETPRSRRKSWFLNALEYQSVIGLDKICTSAGGTQASWTPPSQAYRSAESPRWLTYPHTAPESWQMSTGVGHMKKMVRSIMRPRKRVSFASPLPSYCKDSCGDMFCGNVTNKCLASDTFELAERMKSVPRHAGSKFPMDPAHQGRGFSPSFSRASDSAKQRSNTTTLSSCQRAGRSALEPYGSERLREQSKYKPSPATKPECSCVKKTRRRRLAKPMLAEDRGDDAQYYCQTLGFSTDHAAPGNKRFSDNEPASMAGPEELGHPSLSGRYSDHCLGKFGDLTYPKGHCRRFQPPLRDAHYGDVSRGYFYKSAYLWRQPVPLDADFCNSSITRRPYQHHSLLSTIENPKFPRATPTLDAQRPLRNIIRYPSFYRSALDLRGLYKSSSFDKTSLSMRRFENHRPQCN